MSRWLHTHHEDGIGPGRRDAKVGETEPQGRLCPALGRSYAMDGAPWWRCPAWPFCGMAVGYSAWLPVPLVAGLVSPVLPDSEKALLLLYDVETRVC